MTLVGIFAGRRMGSRLLARLALRMMRLSSTILRMVRKALYLAKRLVGKASAMAKSSLRVMNVSLLRKLSNSALRSLGGGSGDASGGGSGSVSSNSTFFLLVLSVLLPSLFLTAVALAFAAFDLAEAVPNLAMVKVVMD